METNANHGINANTVFVTAKRTVKQTYSPLETVKITRSSLLFTARHGRYKLTWQATRAIHRTTNTSVGK
jgi:hypothetical protein